MQTVEFGHKKYDAPLFEPHITLLGNIILPQEEIIEKAHRLAKLLRPFEAELGEIDISSTYWQSVFVRIKGSASLIDAYFKATEVFSKENEVFMPHMSLVYGDFDARTRAEIARQIRIPKLKFEVSKLIVTPATSDPQEWVHIEEFELGSV